MLSRPAGLSQYGFLSVFSVFQIVKFKNEACTTNTGEMGTCYTESECSDAGGMAAGDCASSFGTCCMCKSLSVKAVKLFIN